MRTLLRLRRYFRAMWKTVAFGLLATALNAALAGFSIALVLPIVEKVFLRTNDPSAPVLHVGEGLRQTWEGVQAALNGAGNLGARLDQARQALTSGLGAIQNQAPPLEVLSWLCVLTLVVIFLKNASDYARKLAFIRVEQSTTEALRRDLFRSVLNLPLGTFQRLSGGELLSRIVTDVEQVKQLTVTNAANFVQNGLLLLVYLAVSIWASLELAVASVLIVPPAAIMTAKLSSKLRRQSGRAQARIAELTSSVNETLGGVRLVKAFGTEPHESGRFAEATARYRRAVVRLLSLDSLASPLSEFWGVTVGVAVLYVGGRLVLAPDSDMSVGRFFVFFFALVSMLHPLKELSSVVARFQRGAAAASRVFEILDLPGEEDAPEAVAVPGLHREIVFENVSFLYRKDRPVLRDVSFRAPAGSTTALVGPSGAGKSTLADLIPRFYRPTTGRILLDGVDIAQVRRRELRALIGIVSQEPILFNDTVLANIRYGTEGASREAALEAARVANAHEFIEAMPEGYETRIGERGVFLSGGQRQRLAIARAILRNPAILILDEATSSLDSEAESLVQEALDRLLTGRTTFVIAHRLSTVRKADQILVLDEGRIVERGTHDELLARPGLYRRLYTLQFRYEETPRLDAVES